MKAPPCPPLPGCEHSQVSVPSLVGGGRGTELGWECLGTSLQGTACGLHWVFMARLALPLAPGPRGLWGPRLWHSSGCACRHLHGGLKPTYRNPRVAWRARGSRRTGAEESATPGLAPFSFLPGVPSVTFLPLWMEILV